VDIVVKGKIHYELVATEIHSYIEDHKEAKLRAKLHSCCTKPVLFLSFQPNRTQKYLYDMHFSKLEQSEQKDSC